MDTNKSITETTKLMSSITSYCEMNGLLIWGEELPRLMKIYLGDKNDFANHQQGACFPIVQLNTNNIENFNLDLALDVSKDKSNCCIFPHQAYKLEDGRIHSEIFVHAFWENNKEIMRRFSNYWIVGSEFDFTHAMKYNSDTYPKGFTDHKLTSYSLNKNWIHLLEVLPDSTVEDFLGNREKLEKLYQSLIEIKKTDPLHAYSLIRNLIKKGSTHAFSEDTSIHLSHILMDILPENLRDHYSEQFPFMKILMEDKHKEELFVQHNNEIIEKLVLPKLEIFSSFKSANLSSKQLLDVSVNILGVLGRNDELKSKGLVSITFDKIKEIACFLTLKNNEVINNHEVAKMFVECMTNCLHNREVLLDNSKDNISDYNIAHIEAVTKATVSHYLLSKEVINTRTLDCRRNKL